MTPDISEFNVTMLGVLRKDFEEWLTSRGLVMVKPPGFDQFIVVPQPMASNVFIAATQLREEATKHDQECPAHDGAACDCG